MRKMLLVLLAAPVLYVTLAAADLSGVWTLTFDPDFSGHPGSANCTFKQDGVKLTGRCGNDSAAHPPITGDVNGQKVTFRVPTGQRDELSATFTADLDRQATTMKGTWRLVDQDKKVRNGKFEGKKS